MNYVTIKNGVVSPIERKQLYYKGVTEQTSDLIVEKHLTSMTGVSIISSDPTKELDEIYITNMKFMDVGEEQSYYSGFGFIRNGTTVDPVYLCWRYPEFVMLNNEVLHRSEEYLLPRNINAINGSISFTNIKSKNKVIINRNFTVRSGNGENDFVTFNDVIERDYEPIKDLFTDYDPGSSAILARGVKYNNNQLDCECDVKLVFR